MGHASPLDSSRSVIMLPSPSSSMSSDYTFSALMYMLILVNKAVITCPIRRALRSLIAYFRFSGILRHVLFLARILVHSRRYLNLGTISELKEFYKGIADGLFTPYARSHSVSRRALTRAQHLKETYAHSSSHGVWTHSIVTPRSSATRSNASQP